MAGKGKPGPDPLFGKALSVTERQRRWRDAKAVREATERAELAALKARVAELDVALAEADLLAGPPVATASKLLARNRRRAIALARNILALANVT